jgi:amidase
MDSALDAMKKAGATLVDVKFGNLEKFGDAEFEVLQFEFKDGLEKYLAGRGSQYKNLDDLIKFNNDNAARRCRTSNRDLCYIGEERTADDKGISRCSRVVFETNS